MHSLQQEKSGLQPGGVWLKPDITSDISNIPSLKIPAKYSKRPYEGNGVYPAVKTARVDADLDASLSPGAFRNPRTSSAHDADDYREKSREEDRDLLVLGRESKNSLDSRSSIPKASESWRTPAKPSHPEKPEAHSKKWTDDFARDRIMSDRDRYEYDRLEWERRRDEVSAKELAAHHVRPSSIRQQGRAAEDRYAQEKLQSVKPIMENDRLPKKGTYDTLMKVVMGSIGPKSRFGDAGGFDEATRGGVRRGSDWSSSERSNYLKHSPASSGSSVPSVGGGRLHDAGITLASSAVSAPRSESWRNLSNEKFSAMSKPAHGSIASRTESWRSSSAPAGGESWRNLKKDVPQGSWMKNTTQIGSSIAGGPGPISRPFDRLPTFGGRPPLGSELYRGMRR